MKEIKMFDVVVWNDNIGVFYAKTESNAMVFVDGGGACLPKFDDLRLATDEEIKNYTPEQILFYKKNKRV